jgi:phosphonate transport system permease protein
VTGRGAALHARPIPAAAHPPAGAPRGRAPAALLLAGVLAWSLADSGAFGGGVFNPGGLPVVGRFLAAAAAPDLTAGYLAEVGRGTAVTLAYAVLGTVLSVLLGLLGACLAARRWRGPAAWAGVRAGLAVPRGLHEALWGLMFVTVLGPDPLAAVLAIAVPFGAVTAKVYADLLDEAPSGPYEALRAAGATRLGAACYALLPYTAADMMSYALYRLDCAVRSAVVLGVVGAGGVGLLLDNAFQDLSYARMWTCLYALLALCAAGDLLSRVLRRRLTARGSLAGGLLAAVLLAAAASAWAWLHLGADAGALVTAQARDEAGYLARAVWPPALPDGGWAALLHAARETMQMSVLALALATVAAVLVAPFAAGSRSPAGARRPAGRLVRAAVRTGLLCARVVPAAVWALLLLFVLHPGPLPGAVALAVYNVGVLGRLTAEVVEDLDPGPERALRSAGAGPAAAYAYAVLPRALPRFLAYAVYRWEVAVRETVIVGLVGAGGLGYLLAGQLAAFDWPGVAGTLLTLVALTAMVDLVGSAARRACR